MSIVREVLPYPFQPSSIAGQQEVESPHEVFVMVLILLVEREHLVGSSREEQDAHILIIHQLLRQLAGLGLAGKQVLEALELIENDQVRFQRIDAAASQLLSQLGDQGIAATPNLDPPRCAVTMKNVADVDQFLPQLLVSPNAPQEFLRQRLIVRQLVAEPGAPPFLADIALE